MRVINLGAVNLVHPATAMPHSLRALVGELRIVGRLAFFHPAKDAPRQAPSGRPGHTSVQLTRVCARGDSRGANVRWRLLGVGAFRLGTETFAGAASQDSDCAITSGLPVGAGDVRRRPGRPGEFHGRAVRYGNDRLQPHRDAREGVN